MSVTPATDDDIADLVRALRSYQQADEEGIMVLVSRQACEEAAARIEQEVGGRKDDAERIKGLETALEGMLAEWDKAARYGSPMAKAANERVTFARTLLKREPRNG